jgi:hypothetical protein
MPWYTSNFPSGGILAAIAIPKQLAKRMSYEVQ